MIFISRVSPAIHTPASNTARTSTARIVHVLASIVIGLGAAACGGDAHSTSPQTPPLTARSAILYGVASDVSWYDDSTYQIEAVAKAKALNAQVMRVGLFWMWIEYVQGNRDWTIPDRIVNALIANGIRPLFVVFGTPSWRIGISEQDDEYFYLHVPTDATAFEQWVSDYAAFVKAAAQRYHGKVTMWELGNEMNDAWFWRPAPSIDQYAAWYQALQAAIKQVDPTALVASGGLDGLADNLDAPSINARAFLKGLYDRHVYPDIVAIHPYSNLGQSPLVHLTATDATNFDDIGVIRTFMVANGQGSHPLWVTEWGWSVDDVTPAQQADYVTQSLGLLESRYASYVTVATYYSEFDPATTYRYGLYTSDFTLRPAGVAFRTFMDSR